MRSGPILFSLLSTPQPTHTAFTGGEGYIVDSQATPSTCTLYLTGPHQPAGRSPRPWNAVGRPQSPPGWAGPADEQVQGGKQSSSQVHLCLPCPSLWQDTERFQARSQELEEKLLSKEQELEQLAQKQKRVCCVLRSPALTASSFLALAHFS